MHEMLRAEIMIHFINKLLDKKTIKRLECLSELLPTIGAKMEGQEIALQELMERLLRIVTHQTVEGVQINISLHIKLQYVIYLHNQGWPTQVGFSSFFTRADPVDALSMMIMQEQIEESVDCVRNLISSGYQEDFLKKL